MLYVNYTSVKKKYKEEKQKSFLNSIYVSSAVT